MLLLIVSIIHIIGCVGCYLMGKRRGFYKGKKEGAADILNSPEWILGNRIHCQAYAMGGRVSPNLRVNFEAPEQNLHSSPTVNHGRPVDLANLTETGLRQLLDQAIAHEHYEFCEEIKRELNKR